MRRTVPGRLGWLGALFLTVSVALAQNPSAGKQQKSPENSADPLAHGIRRQLAVLPYASVFDYVEYTLKGNNVTLSGYVVRPTLKVDAEEAVKTLEGVGTVVNQIEVLPASASDDGLRRQIYRAIYEDAVLQRYAVEHTPAIHILVKTGRVMLEGIVETEEDKRLAGARAGGAAGVAELKNNLQVRAKGAASP